MYKNTRCLHQEVHSFRMLNNSTIRRRHVLPVFELAGSLSEEDNDTSHAFRAMLCPASGIMKGEMLICPEYHVVHAEYFLPTASRQKIEKAFAGKSCR